MRHSAKRRAFEWLQARGVHVTKMGSWDPVPDTRTLTAVAGRITEMRGVDWRDDEQLKLLDHLAGWSDEYDRLGDWFDLDNSQFGRVDGPLYYAMIRDLRPRRIVEIGSGYSTMLAVRAVAANGAGAIICIDPQPRADISDLPVTWRRQRVEDVELGLFASLIAGDVLFIDSSHVLRTGGDVAFEYLEILPRLAPGVVVHIHDIFLPAEYPAEWLIQLRMWPTEQYVLQAFLAFNPAFEILLGASWLHLNHPQRLDKAFRHRDGGTPGSFWMRRRG